MGISWGNGPGVFGAGAEGAYSVTGEGTSLPRPVEPPKGRPIAEWCENNTVPYMTCHKRPEFIVTLRKYVPGESTTLLKPRLLCRNCKEGVEWVHRSGSRSPFRIADIGLVTEW